MSRRLLKRPVHSQMLQPFATIDSLVRLGLAAPGDLHITTFDLSSRVDHHLQVAYQRARSGADTCCHFRGTWTSAGATRWLRTGNGWENRIGEVAPAVVPPSNAGSVRIRAVRVRPAAVTLISAQDLNVVLQRLEQTNERENCDLIIATNVLVYYDVFEQSLAAVNLAAMLRRGGLLLSNNLLYELPASSLTLAGEIEVGYTDSGDGDRILWYERKWNSPPISAAARHGPRRSHSSLPSRAASSSSRHARSKIRTDSPASARQTSGHSLARPPPMKLNGAVLIFLIVALAFAGLTRGATAQTETFLVYVSQTLKHSGLSPGEHVLSFSTPVEIPGARLPAGPYIFRLLGERLVQVQSVTRSKVYATFFTIPSYGTGDESRERIKFELTGEDALPRIKAWYLPGQRDTNSSIRNRSASLRNAKSRESARTRSGWAGVRRRVGVTRETFRERSGVRRPAPQP